ncbi:HNH endonuclease domain-containing protein [Mucilaginibacter sp. CSA2-8R]|uniref:HNH endonuclease domain-containing protein n=1 Tax=Mucilaginibacter sp. CSA2-8R TaxID=3141542 RepID=UPI00315DB196
MSLPQHPGLPVNKLAACFNSKVTTYKFYWFLSILQAVEHRKSIIYKRELFAGMISNAWYTVNYFHVSFGHQDQLQSAIETLLMEEVLGVDEKQIAVLERLATTENQTSIRKLNHFNKQVPHWFLSPWFPNADRKEIYERSKIFDNDCLYSLEKDRIIVNPNWFEYLIYNARVLKDYCYWNLTLYLQDRNPNVPDIAGKLIKPAIRTGLTGQRKNYWDVVLKEVGTVDCIYTGEKLSIGNYAVEHFIPFAFVSHDLIWNLIPADKSFNCTKSNKLPSLDTYFEPFYKLQATAIEVMEQVNPRNKYLEDYLTILPELSLIQTDGQWAKQRYKEQLQPLITIASNNGFNFF